jgi:aryl-alcohol dehydrogenase-like predicted oxidoreductase
MAIANAESRAALAASRGRIVAAGDESRRRIERDLHDGAQQRLVHAVIVKLALRRWRTPTRTRRNCLPFAEHERIGVIAYSPMGSGMLTGGMTHERITSLAEDDWRKHDARVNEPQLSRNLELVERLKAVADRYDSTPGTVAVAWTLRHPAVDGAIADQVDPILTAADLELTDQDIAEIEGSTR